ncbi:methyltransferase CmcJ [Asticcacaulis biprosthecium C19]|uniref:Methyltransferase CmcJ n=1 Tax=Asticcacaulis biprosthecium C19 TaxID=715226 RepID=F4QMI1_9CAUL|nr:CmcJ/NvfI family oxidoreductase [Asticcacaulis biprosthecium]EGF91422.1 methyltransferase CmcJ [Asticcacaulis biprosthecium C19]
MTVETTLNGFIRRDLKLDGPVQIRIKPPFDSMPWAEAPPITIQDARVLQGGQDAADFLDARGFVLLDHLSAVKDWDAGGAAPLERNEIARIYMPEVEALIRNRLMPGQRLEFEQGPFLIRRGPNTGNIYANGVHQDYGLTPDDYQESLEAFSSAAFAAAWRARFERPEVAGFVVLDLWRPVYMAGPLRHMPLAVCDPHSIEMEDLVPAALVGFAPSGKNTNQLSLKYSPEQRWWYYPGITTGEVLVFKLFEYFKDGRRKGLQTCFHTAFTDPRTPEDAEPRQSCEHRVGVFVMG